MPDALMALDRFLDDLHELPEPQRPAESVLRNMARTAAEHSGWLVRVATGYAMAVLEKEHSLGWVLALPTDPTLLVLREDLDDTERVWVLARLLVLAQAPAPPLLDEYAVIPSPDYPDGPWPLSQAHQAEVDVQAAEVLAALGVPAQVAEMLARPAAT